MAQYRRNEGGVDKARSLIDAHQYVLDSDWSDAQPTTEEENEKIDRDGYDDFGMWHLAVETTASDDTKEKYGFVYGDFRRVHRSGLIAAKQRAAEWDHAAIEHAAGELLDHLDELAAD